MVKGAKQGAQYSTVQYFYDRVGSNLTVSPSSSKLDFQDSNPDFSPLPNIFFSIQFRTALFDTRSQRLI